MDRVSCRGKVLSSPNNAEREKLGYSSAWLHHKGRNKHHYEYWIDYGLGEQKGLIGMCMPKKYVVEMFIDRIAASKIYMKEMYDDGQPLAYYQRGLPYTILHKDSKALLEICWLKRVRTQPFHI